MGLDDQVISVSDAAELVGRSERRIRQLCTAGRISARKIGREWLIDRGNLLEFFYMLEQAERRRFELKQIIDETEIK